MALLRAMHPGRNSLYWAPICIVVFTLAVYWEIPGHDFLTDWDDPIYVTANEYIRGLSLENLKMVFSTFYLGNYAPIQMLSYMIDFELWGLNPFGFKLTNLLLHVSNGLLFYLLLLKFGFRRITAFVAGFIFLCHPVQVESVAWISQRKTLLAMLFSLITLHGYLIYVEREGCTSLVSYGATLMFFVLALLSKPVAVIVPGILILRQVCSDNRNICIRREKWLIPFIVCAILAIVLACISQSPDFHGGKSVYYGGSIWPLFLTMPTVLMRYVGMLFWPVNLSPGYYISLSTEMTRDVSISLGFVALLVVVGIAFYRRNQQLFFWYALFFMGLIPVSQVVPLVTLMNDRYLYFPLLGASAFLASCADILAERRYARPMIIGCVSLLLIPLPVLAHQRTEVWRNSVKLWSDAVLKMGNAPIAWTNLGAAALQMRDRNSAVLAFTKAASMSANSAKPFTYLGLMHAETGNYVMAEQYLRSAIGINPDDVSGFVNLGMVYLMQGKLDLAERICSIARNQTDCSHDLWVLQGNLHAARNNAYEAFSCYRTAMEHPAKPYDRDIARALMAAVQGNREQAVVLLRRAIYDGNYPVTPTVTNIRLRSLQAVPLYEHIVESLLADSTI